MAYLTPQQQAAAASTGPWLPVSTVGMVSTPGQMQTPSYAGGVPPRSVPSIPFTAKRPSAFSAYTYPPSSAYRDLSEVFPSDRLPQGQAGLPAPPGSGLTPQQVAALGGWSVDPLTGQFSYAPASPTNPAVAAATQIAVPSSIPMPRARPVTSMEDLLIAAGVQPGVPMGQQGANPGLGQALIGNGVMSPDIPPQGPPPTGVAPTAWRGDPQPSPPATSASRLLGPPVSSPTPSRPVGPTGTAAGYGYINGQRQPGYAPIMAGGQSFTPTNGVSAYALANAAGQINALNRQAGAYGNAGGYTYQGGIKTGYAPVQVGGQTITPTSGAQGYALANAAGVQNTQNKATKAPKTSSSKNNDGSWATGASSGSPFW